MDRPTFVIICLSAIVLGLILFQTYLQAEIGVLAFEYTTIKEETDTYKKKNQILQEQVLKKGSLTRIDETAKESGFVPARYIYILPTPTKAPDTKTVSESERQSRGASSPLHKAFSLLIVLGAILLCHKLAFRRVAIRPIYDTYVRIDTYCRKVKKRVRRFFH